MILIVKLSNKEVLTVNPLTILYISNNNKRVYVTILSYDVIFIKSVVPRRILITCFSILTKINFSTFKKPEAIKVRVVISLFEVA